MTFSITARCQETGQLGVAVSTKLPAVGNLCPYAESGIGAIATQSFVNPYIGINGLQYLKESHNASEVLDIVLNEDPDPEMRQVCIVDSHGKSAAFTGEKCDGWSGHLTGENYAVAGNMLVGGETVKDMVRTFEDNSDLSLGERLLKSLESGQKAGGDKRGRQSAALLVVDREKYPFIDLRVDEHKNPVKELRRIYTITVKELFPFMKMLPTLENPKGSFDLEQSKHLGILQDKD